MKSVPYGSLCHFVTKLREPLNRALVFSEEPNFRSGLRTDLPDLCTRTDEWFRTQFAGFEIAHERAAETISFQRVHARLIASVKAVASVAESFLPMFKSLALVPLVADSIVIV